MRRAGRGHRASDASSAKDGGSVFVESIIAAAIVAMALGATFRVISDGATRDRGVEARRTALLVAQSRLAAVGSETPLIPGDAAGLTGDMVWRVRISPYEDGVNDSGAGALWKVTVSVMPRAGGADLARLETLRLGRAAG